jgi:hypothetical protein
MERVEGKTIQVYWLDDEDGQIIAAHAYINDQMQCELILQPSYSRAKAELTPAGIKARELMSRYVATIEAYRKAAVRNLQAVMVMANGKEPKLAPTFFIKDLEKYRPGAAAEAMPENDLSDAEQEYVDNEDMENQTSFAKSTLERF